MRPAEHTAPEPVPVPGCALLRPRPPPGGTGVGRSVSRTREVEKCSSRRAAGRTLAFVPTHTRVLHNKRYAVLAKTPTKVRWLHFGRSAKLRPAEHTAPDPVPVPGCALLRPPGARTSHKVPALLPDGKI